MPLLQRADFILSFIRQNTLPSTQLWWGHTWIASPVSSSELPTARETWTAQRESKKGHKGLQWLEHLSCEEGLTDLGLFSLRRRWLTELYQYTEIPEGRVQGIVSQDLFRAAQWHQHKRQYTQTKPRRFPLNITKLFLIVILWTLA